MKKFLLSLLCLISFMAINAETYTFNMKDKHGASSISTLTEWTEGVFTFTPKKENGQTNPAYNKAGDVRIYAKGTFTITCNNANMTSISFTISTQGKKRLTTITSDSGEMTVTGATNYNCSWVGDANSVTFTIGDQATLGTDGSSKAGQLCFTDITIETGAGDVVVVAKPTFSVVEDVYTEPFDLILSAEEGNTIYYTLDGSTPTVDSDIFDGEAIRISEYTVVKAIAVNGQDVPSSVATATYTFQNTANTAMTVAEALAWIEAGKDETTEQYVAGYITAIDEVSTQYGNATYSIADAIDGTDVLLVYRGKYLNGDKFTAEDQIEIGDKVLIYGKLISFVKDETTTPEIATNNYIISILEDVSVGVEDTMVDANAPVEYYNLQGVKVANPENGIFIKKQGGRTSKVVL